MVEKKETQNKNNVKSYLEHEWIVQNKIKSGPLLLSHVPSDRCGAFSFTT